MKLGRSLFVGLVAVGSVVRGAVISQVGSGDGLGERDLWSSLVSEIGSATTCAGCEAILGTLKVLAGLGNTAFVDIITEICILSKADDPDVCRGAVSLEGPIIANALRGMTIPSHTSQLFCITFFGLCPYPPVTPWTIPFPSPKPPTKRPPPSGQPPLQVVHISDIHIDPLYTEGANSNCSKPICCRSYTPSDAPGNTSSPAGHYGNVKCDAPVSLEESMYAAIKTLVPAAALTLFTGDIVDHAVWLTTQNQNIQDINDAYTRMSGLPPVYGTAGNHEASPSNAFPPSAVKTTLSEQWVYDTLSSDWSQWIGAVAAQQADVFGAYSAKVPGQNLRIISLNTNLWYQDNYWLYEKNMEMDPSGQFSWLVSELQGAENAGERVWVIGHMPMGLSDALRDPSSYFDQIVNRYEATIAAMFFGHTHTDQFQLTYSNYTSRSALTVNQVSYIAPSLTPTSGYPAFRVYTVDPVTYGVLDHTTYAASMPLVGAQTSPPAWSEYYSAKATYGPLVNPPVTDPAAELTPQFWHELTEVFESDDGAFAGWVGRKSRGFGGDGGCTGACKTGEICQMRAARSEFNCGVVTPGIHFRKRDATAEGYVEGRESGVEGGELERRDNGALRIRGEVWERSEGSLRVDECEGSEMRMILGRLAARGDGVLERAVGEAVGRAERRGVGARRG